VVDEIAAFDAMTHFYFEGVSVGCMVGVGWHFNLHTVLWQLEQWWHSCEAPFVCWCWEVSRERSEIEFMCFAYRPRAVRASRTTGFWMDYASIHEEEKMESIPASQSPLKW